MSYQNSPFGGANNVEKDQAGGSASPTNAHYGIRDTQDGIVGGGKLESQGSIVEAVVYVKASDFTIDSGTLASFDTQLTLPVGSIPVDAVFEVTEAFTTTGGTTSATLNVGEKDDEGTNGFTITDATAALAIVTELDAAGDGDWNGGTALPSTAVGVQFVTAGTMTSIDTGRAKVVFRYRKV